MKRFWPVLVVAVIIGLLFRLAETMQLSILRMFATQGIVIAGFLAAWALKKQQIEPGIRQVRDALTDLSLPSDVTVANMTIGRSPGWLVETEKERWMIGSSDLAQSASVGRAARTILRQSESLRAAARQHGFTEDGNKRLHAVVVLLRRALRTQGAEAETLDPGFSVTLVNPEGLAPLIQDRAQ